MILAVDEKIPYWREAFSSLGEIRLFSGRSLTPERVKGAEILIVRSITPVGPELLRGSRITFVGTASVGTDHVDLSYLRMNGIQFANAAGSNANAVSEHVVAALLEVARRRNWRLHDKSLAIIGVGHVGSAVAKKARALGMNNLLLCDPPLKETTRDTRYLPLEEVLQADILTLHVPLTRTGSHPTFRMISAEILGRLAPHQFIFNTSRGAVVDGRALRDALEDGRIAGAALDVWEGEPRIDYRLLEAVDLGTPHIAGFSLMGKVRGTEMVLQALCAHRGWAVPWQGDSVLPAVQELTLDAGLTPETALHRGVTLAYPIVRDDARLRALAKLEPDVSAPEFDRLRTEYDLRPEFSRFNLRLPPESGAEAPIFAELGFRIATTVRDA